VPTDIYFPGDSVPLRVDQDPSEVAEAFGSARGLPFRLTCQGGITEVYINPGAVVLWSAAASVPESALEQESPQRQAVTDLWGNPLRKKRRG
jgi:hypothetical protein